MDLIEDEPRQHPKPLPFFQNSLVEPTVPEVSLLLPEHINSQSKKNDFFSNTEFLSYNSWKWKHINSHKNSDSKNMNNYIGGQDCYLIKDKYCTSDIEKRKNEILYGELEEPRRPLPPRTSPVIPTCIQSFFSDSSFDDLKCPNNPNEKQQKTPNQINCTDIKLGSSYSSHSCLQKDLNNSQNLYSIITEQNKQLHVLQEQIQQLLKLQDVKDKQIKQLLKSQESKEKKIKQLLQCLDNKEQELEQLTKSNQKQEQNIQELMKAQELTQKENFNLLKTLNEITHKEMQTVGVMTTISFIDAETCTSLDVNLRQCTSQKSENIAENISVIRESSRFDEKSLSLHSSDLPVIQENISSLQSSIHLDIQDFPDSSDESESEAGIPSNSFTDSKESQSKNLGYTFYNNVLTQLKDIIHNSKEKENEKSDNHGKLLETEVAENYIRKHNKSIQSAHELVNNSQEKTERFSEKHQTFGIKDSNSPSDVSLKINALALKYLKKEQISEFGLQTSVPNACQHDVTIYNVTNLSFGSLRYLDRYQMLPEGKENQKCILNAQKGESSPGEFLRRKKKLAIEESITSNIGNILDMSALTQQPKFL